MPHSEISGSKPVRGSPKLIAAYHVLHRLSAPRHPPDTLIALDYARNQKTDASKIPFTSPTTVFQSEKTSFASSTSGSPAVKLRAHDWLLRHGKRFAPPNQRSPFNSSSRVLRQTGCASSSQCQFITRSIKRLSASNRLASNIASFRRARRPHEIRDLQTDISSHRRPVATIFRQSGGARRDRTDDLMLAKHALSQLSYGPRGTVVQSNPTPPLRAYGGPGRTRTSDLTLIKRAL